MDESKLQLFDRLCNSDRVKHFPITDSVPVDTANILPGSYDEFYHDFACMFKTNLAALEPIEDRLNTCQSSIDQYERLFFQQANDTFVPMQQISRSFSLSNEEIDQVDPNSELGTIFKQRKKIISTASRYGRENERNSVENLSYRPFRSDAYNDNLSDTTVHILDILDKVTRAQKFQEDFLSSWNKVVRSETSQYILIDAFWWFYLKYFTKLTDADDQCEKHFTRIAKNYVELLLSVDPWFRDKFFDVYASYLSQAIYQTFFDTCPDSRFTFTDKFKEFVASTVTEWISGVQATPDSFKSWRIPASSTMLTLDNGSEQISSSNDIYKKILRLEEELEALGSSNEDGSTAIRAPHPTAKKNAPFMPASSADIADDLISLSNPSTLVGHFLQYCDIQTHTPRLRSVHRTHVKQWPKEQ